MNFLILPMGSAGDHNPLIALGAALQARGHRATLVTHAHFRPAVERAGLGYHEIGTAEQYHEALNHPDIWHPTRGLHAVFQPSMAQLIRRQYEAVAEYQARGRVAVVAGSIALGGRLAQEKLGVPLVSVHLQPAILRSILDPTGTPSGPIPTWLPRWMVRSLFWMVDRRLIDPIVGPRLEPIRAELGLPPVRRYFKDWIHSPVLAIALFPKWFASAPDWPAQVRQTGFPLYDSGEEEPMSPEVERFLDAGDPPVVVTFGSAMRQGHAPLQEAASALGQLGRRGLLLTPFREQLPVVLPSGVAHFDYVPFRRLLPRAAALVHHGGIGTCAQALAAGVPQLVMPLGHDQPDNAWRLRRLGVARVVMPRQFTTRNVARELDALLTDPKLCATCKEIARRFESTEPIVDTCRLIEAAVNPG